MNNNRNTIKEAIIKALEIAKKPLTYSEVYDLIIKNNLYTFTQAKTPKNIVSSKLGSFIRKKDNRVKRIRHNNKFLYYLPKYESEIKFPEISGNNTPNYSTKKGFDERDLHLLLSTFLHHQGISAKTIYHEKSSGSRDTHQKWIHPDMVGVKFFSLKNKASNSLLKITNKAETYKIFSYEIKKEIKSDYDLKKSYFQAVSNSSWSNFGFLVAFEINDNLKEEMERLNQSFGIGIIHLKPNPYESQILFPAKHHELDFKTIDKLSEINTDFEQFIHQIEKILTASERYIKATIKEFEEICDPYLEKDSEIEKYCKEKNIPIDETE